MKAGRELDVLIDTKVMGRVERWTVVFCGMRYDDYPTKEDAEKRAAHILSDSRASVINYYDVLPYSKNIAAAWKVLEKLQEDEWYIEIQDSWSGWTVTTHEGNSQRKRGLFEASADTIEHAICLAALKSVGVETS